MVQVLEVQQAWLLRQVRLQPVWSFRSVAVRLHFCGIAQWAHWSQIGSALLDGRERRLLVVWPEAA